jgi:hypothetical protein
MSNAANQNQTQDFSHITWNADERLLLTNTAKRIYAEDTLDDKNPSKYRAMCEAVSALPLDRQKPIKSLSHVYHWLNKPGHWPNGTEPVDVIEAVKAEREAAAAKSEKLDFDSVEPAAEDTIAETAAEPQDFKTVQTVRVVRTRTRPRPAAVEEAPQADQGTQTEESAHAAEEPPVPDAVIAALPKLASTHEANAAAFFSMPEKKPEQPQAPLFDESAMVSASAHRAAEQASTVTITHKKIQRDVSETPEALIQRGLLGMLNERIEGTIDRRASMILDTKARKFVEDAVGAQMGKFVESMTVLTSSIEASLTDMIANFERRMEDNLLSVASLIATATPTDPGAGHGPQHTILPPQTGLITNAGLRMVEDAVQEEAHSPTAQINSEPVDPPKPATGKDRIRYKIAILGVHSNICDIIKRKYGQVCDLITWSGGRFESGGIPLREDTDYAAVIIGTHGGGLEIAAALRHLPKLPIRKVNGSNSSIAKVLDEVLNYGPLKLEHAV